jgi:hypothetical protein
VLVATSPTAPDTESPTTTEPVYGGPRWYRSRIRTFGPLLALVPPVVLWIVERVGREVLDGKIRIGWSVVLRAIAAPGLLVVGFPLGRSSLHPLGIAISVAFWLVLGYAAARVATRSPVAQFRDFWRAYAWLAGAVVVGVIVALIGATVLLDQSLLVGV